MAMLILGLITGGMFPAFVFGRRVNWRAEGEMMARNYSSQTAEELRLAVTGASPTGLTLAPGLYCDEKLGNAGTFASQSPAFVTPLRADNGVAATPLPALNLPDDFQAKYQTNPGSGTGSITNHGDGKIMIVEDANTDVDGDGLQGFDFNGDGTTDMKRVKVKVQWTTPKP